MSTATVIPVVPTDDAGWQTHLEEEVERYVSALIEHYDPQRIILFGSLAAGRAHLWSDIDLVIVADTGRPFLDRTKEALFLLRMRVDLDILIYTPVEFEALSRERPFFQREILQGKVLFEKR